MEDLLLTNATSVRYTTSEIRAEERTKVNPDEVTRFASSSIMLFFTRRIQLPICSEQEETSEILNILIQQ
jgi:hypothetical protein